jgi:transposase
MRTRGARCILVLSPESGGLPVAAAARLVGEHDTRLWRVPYHYREQARARLDTVAVSRVAIDETAARRGHAHITLFIGIDEARVLYVTEGKDAATIAAFAKDLTAHSDDPDSVEEVCIDMSSVLISGTAESLPAASVTSEPTMCFPEFISIKIHHIYGERMKGFEKFEAESGDPYVGTLRAHAMPTCHTMANRDQCGSSQGRIRCCMML